MIEIHEKAYAKLNISLDVLGLLPNGYHEMSMVMQSVSLHDDVLLRLGDSGEIRLETNFGFLPRDEGNIACRAAKLFFQRLGRPCPGLDIRLEKRIPVCAGMGGGSSDGAAVLRGLNKLCGDIFDRAALEAMAAEIGSDIPFCVAGGTQLATGTGTTLRDIPPLPDCGIVICKPAFSIRTPELSKKSTPAASACTRTPPEFWPVWKRGMCRAFPAECIMFSRMFCPEIAARSAG